MTLAFLFYAAARTLGLADLRRKVDLVERSIRLGELRDRTHENQRRHRASGLNLVVASIVLWNTVCLERADAAIRRNEQPISDEVLTHLSPLKWKHINLTGDYHWRKDAGLGNRKLPPLRTSPPLASGTP